MRITTKKKLSNVLAIILATSFAIGFVYFKYLSEQFNDNVSKSVEIFIVITGITSALTLTTWMITDAVKKGKVIWFWILIFLNVLAVLVYYFGIYYLDEESSV